CCLVRSRERTGLGSGFFPVWGAILKSVLPTASLPVFCAAAGLSASITQAGQHQGSSTGKSGDWRAVREGLDRDRQSRTKSVFCRRDRPGNPISGSDRFAGGPMGGRANHHGEARKSHLVSAGGYSMGVKRST